MQQRYAPSIVHFGFDRTEMNQNIDAVLAQYRQRFRDRKCQTYQQKTDFRSHPAQHIVVEEIE